MAKQSFSVGQVLTAAQMTSLQQTAMLGGSATAKTTSYTLVAADAGTVVSVNSTSATTITVNTGLFAAGDTVTIQNWGTGSVTITAGTATVNTAGSLIVPQYDGGVLYFTSASAAIYFDFVQAGAVSPLTTKGDIYTFGSSDTRLAVGTNDTVLTADSSTATGLKWAAVAGGGLTLLSTTTLSGISTVISSINQSYVGLLAIITNVNVNTATSLTIELDSYSGACNLMRMIPGTSVTSTGDLRTDANLPTTTQTTDSYFYLYLPNYNTTDTGKLVDFWCSLNGSPIESLRGGFERTGAIDSLKFDTTNGTSTFSNGTVKLYGVK